MTNENTIQEDLWLDVSRTLVQNKYRFSLGNTLKERNINTAVYFIDIRKALAILKERYDLVPKDTTHAKTTD
jgi:hypothetical protein